MGLDHLVDAEVLPHSLTASVAESASQFWIGEEPIGELLKAGAVTDSD